MRVPAGLPAYVRDGELSGERERPRSLYHRLRIGRGYGFRVAGVWLYLDLRERMLKVLVREHHLALAPMERNDDVVGVLRRHEDFEGGLPYLASRAVRPVNLQYRADDLKVRHSLQW